MVLPIVKILSASFRTFSKPINGIIIRTIKSRGSGSQFRTMFIRCGQMAHRGELWLNRYVTHDELGSAPSNEEEIKLYVKPLSDDAAFSKGVEYFSEGLFFYGLLISLTIYEIKKATDQGKINKAIMKKAKE